MKKKWVPPVVLERFLVPTTDDLWRSPFEGRTVEVRVTLDPSPVPAWARVIVTDDDINGCAKSVLGADFRAELDGLVDQLRASEDLTQVRLLELGFEF